MTASMLPAPSMAVALSMATRTARVPYRLTSSMLIGPGMLGFCAPVKTGKVV